MTPTPEDIRLAEQIDEQATVGVFGMACVPIDRVARLIAAHTAPLREVAEIGRLAVEEEKLRCALKAKYMAAGGKADGCMGLYDDFYRASTTHREAVCAYLAKQEESK